MNSVKEEEMKATESFTFCCRSLLEKLGCYVQGLSVGQIKEGTLTLARLWESVIRCVRKMPEHVTAGWDRSGSLQSKVITPLLAFSTFAHSCGEAAELC